MITDLTNLTRTNCCRLLTDYEGRMSRQNGETPLPPRALFEMTNSLRNFTRRLERTISPKSISRSSIKPAEPKPAGVASETLIKVTRFWNIPYGEIEHDFDSCPDTMIIQSCFRRESIGRKFSMAVVVGRKP